MQKKTWSLTGVLGLAVWIFSTQLVWAGSATLTWNANTEPDLEGYKIYWDTTSHVGNCPAGFPVGNKVDVGNVTSHTLNNLTDGQTYYFQITAHDVSQNESPCSVSPGEVSKLITPGAATYSITNVVTLISNWLKTGQTAQNGDTNVDGLINTKDWGVMMSKWL